MIVPLGLKSGGTRAPVPLVDTPAHNVPEWTQSVYNPIHTSNIVEATDNFSACCFDIVVRVDRV